MEDCRLIALCNVYYKIISKLLSLRLKPVLPSIICLFSGRAISDNVLITHEVLHYLKTSQAQQKCSMVVKMDMSKAYNRVEWDFVSQVLHRLGFHEKWINWVMECITSVSYKFLINDNIYGVVKPHRGIRQRDPISPYIFILCGEVFSTESAMHVFFTCRFAKEVWKLIPLKNPVHIADDLDFKNAMILFRRATCLLPTRIKHSILPWVCWLLWTARNKLIFEDKTSTPADLAIKALTAAREWDRAQPTSTKSASFGVSNQMSSNQRSAYLSKITCKVDAAWDSSTKKAGIAWIRPGHPGLYVGFGSGLIGSGSFGS